MICYGCDAVIDDGYSIRTTHGGGEVHVCSGFRRGAPKMNCLRRALHKIHAHPRCWFCGTTEPFHIARGTPVCQKCEADIAALQAAAAPRDLCSVAEDTLPYVTTEWGSTRDLVRRIVDVAGVLVERDAFRRGHALIVQPRPGWGESGWRLHVSLTEQQKVAVSGAVALVGELLVEARREGSQEGYQQLESLVTELREMAEQIEQGASQIEQSGTSKEKA